MGAEAPSQELNKQTPNRNMADWDDDDWEAEDIAPVEAKEQKPKSNWDDDESEDETEKVFVPEAKPKDESKKSSKIKSKKDVPNPKKKKEAEAAAATAPGSKEDLQKLVEDGDYALTEELFGVQASGSASKPVN